MTIQLIDGFDLYAGVVVNTGLQAKWTQFNVAGTPHSMVTGRFGGQAVRCQRTGTGTGGTIQRTFPGNYASFAIGQAMRWSSFGTIVATMPDLAFYDSTPTIQCGLKVNGTGAIEVYRYTSETAGTLLGTSAAGVIVANTWHYVEVEVTISDTVGVFKVYVDGTQVLNLTALDNKNTANAFATAIRYSSAAGTGWGLSLDVDDFYLVDAATKLGERRVETIRPTADTAQKDFTASTGTNNAAMVDDTTADATDYVQASVVGNLDLYDMGDLSSTPATIDAVQLTAFALKTDATARSIALVADVSGSQTVGGNQALAASTSKFDTILATKPAGGAWDSTAVNALKAGPKVTV